MKIIIIGSGIAGITCAEKIRQLSTDAKITLLTKATGAGTAPSVTLTPQGMAGNTRITGWLCEQVLGQKRHVPASCRGT